MITVIYTNERYPGEKCPGVDYELIVADRDNLQNILYLFSISEAVLRYTVMDSECKGGCAGDLSIYNEKLNVHPKYKPYSEYKLYWPKN